MKLKRVLVTSVVLCIMLVVGNFSSVHGQKRNIIVIEGTTWRHSSLKVLIVPPIGQSWWKPSFLNASLHAIDEWNDAILTYSSNYSGFSYISNLRMIPTLGQSMEPAFDVYLSWIEASSGLSGGELGQSQTRYQGHIVINNTVVLSTRYPSDNYDFSEADMQNIALHELGHSLGLGHSNATEDIMYPILALKQDVMAISTLDLYAVSEVFGWMNSTEFILPQNSLVSLPGNVPYLYLPIPTRDIPPPQPQSLLEIVAQLVERFFQRPELLVAVIGATVVLMLAAALNSGRRKKRRMLSSPPII